MPPALPFHYLSCSCSSLIGDFYACDKKRKNYKVSHCCKIRMNSLQVFISFICKGRYFKELRGKHFKFNQGQKLWEDCEIVVMVCDNCGQGDKKSCKIISHNSCIYLFFCTATPINTPITMRKRRAHAIPAYAPCERLMLESGSPFLRMITGSLCSGDSSYATISLGSTIKSVSRFSSERESWIVKLLKHIHPAKQYR